MAKNNLSGETERPKRTPLILCTILQTIGWLLLVDMAILLITTLLHPRPWAVEGKEPFDVLIVLTSYWFAIDFFFMGIAAVILGQLARFIFQKTDRPGLMLRWGSKILIVFACLTVLWAVFQYLSFKPSLPEAGSAFAVLAFFFPVAVKASMLILLAQILKRTIPIIEEFKALV
jgi:hypothetical protein